MNKICAVLRRLRLNILSCHSLFSLPLGVIGRLYSVTVALSGHFLYYFIEVLLCVWIDGAETQPYHSQRKPEVGYGGRVLWLSKPVFFFLFNIQASLIHLQLYVITRSAKGSLAHLWINTEHKHT